MRPTTTVLLILLGLTLLVSWWLTTFEKTTELEYVGFSGEAVFNRYYAAQKLLEEVEIEADGVADFSPANWLPETLDTLVLTIDDIVRNGPIMEEWVSNGGHLIITPGEGPELQKVFLSEGLSARFVKPETASDASELHTQSVAKVQGDRDDDPYQYAVDLDRTYYRIEFDGTETPQSTISDEQGLIVTRARHGDGVLTIVATDNYFENASLGENDHARLLLDIVAGSFEPGKVWFIYNNRFDSLWTYLWKHIPLTLGALCVALLLWLRSILPRFGPPIKVAETDRRSLMEHIVAAGLFEWKHAEREALVSSTARRVLSLAELRYAGIERLSLEQQSRRLASISGLPAQDIADALGSIDGHHPRGFTKHMQTLQKLRDRL